ncbi:hypothetical protein A3B45_04590 [Candidatus Daviesbacteria bacterium RIFCSPLOWO2_01_FULL_39_12]|uniref:Sortase n=1 Tax=Candidatus Daviesbacteria bacterium RIFCSPLOWO2_01_FULL_39_12 TaxID=1797785 RepID=A0A1F5KMY7_9BACT|nr:MAG: hypothetical protein A3D79_00150 [Candidatus Daviesbacteria bacterium RIFCSPHIGHO2_02_FULL_39_8]OGE42210.1 MAG: hypothetical protein A3B45_04590 [Candidatus Daviesbacteria bacterium RIFCSPLOWO2_01_FULL_39_12]
MLKNYKLALLVRVVGYCFFVSGLVMTIFMLGPTMVAEAGYRIDQMRGIRRLVAPQTQPGQTFSNIQSQEDLIVPVSTEYGIVIEKINANARIIPNVNSGNEKEYSRALTKGVAEASGSTKPGEAGNLYLFSHSTDAPWNIVRYNAVFYLLRELVAGDRVIIFYNNRRYDYVVFDKVVVSPKETAYLTNKYDVPVLTLQTCDPPGTLINRLVVRARLVSS